MIDFEIEKICIPVGRVISIYMYPLSFLEFLSAKNETLLIEMILEHDDKTKLNDAVHQKMLHLLGEYFAVGGMPELGLETTSWLLEPELNLVNKGAITKAFVGQELLAHYPYDMKAQLYYWHREARNSSAEIDYLIQKNHLIIPIEVKSGAAGTLKSLKFFLENYRHSNYGIRFSSLNYAAHNFVQNFPLYAVAKARNTNQDYFKALLD